MQQTYKDAFGTRWMTDNALMQSPYGGGGVIAAANIQTLQEAKCNGEPLPSLVTTTTEIRDRDQQITFGDTSREPQDNRDKAYIEVKTIYGTQIYLNIDWKPAGDEPDVGISPDQVFESMGDVADYLRHNAVLNEDLFQETEEAWRLEFIKENRDDIQWAVTKDVREQLQKLNEGEFVNAVYRAVMLEDAGSFEFDGYFIGEEELRELSDSIEYVLNESSVPRP